MKQVWCFQICKFIWELHCAHGSVKSTLQPSVFSRVDICYILTSLYCHSLLHIGMISSLSFWRSLQHVSKEIQGNLIILCMTIWLTSCSMHSTLSKNPCSQEPSDQANSLMSESSRRASRLLPIEAGRFLRNALMSMDIFSYHTSCHSVGASWTCSPYVVLFCGMLLLPIHITSTIASPIVFQKFWQNNINKQTQ